ncbi:hypothetical protein G6F24_018122 [Rhizopus arrhizus]|nr:hypothetical protein G6F24_018122 [Rhizopus arrhizus]
MAGSAGGGRRVAGLGAGRQCVHHVAPSGRVRAASALLFGWMAMKAARVRKAPAKVPAKAAATPRASQSPAKTVSPQVADPEARRAANPVVYEPRGDTP